MTRRAERTPPPGTRSLLDDFASGDPDGVLQLGELFSGLGRRSFGMLLFLSTLPAFMPIPGLAGALSGPFVVLLGLQLLVGRRNPWLPMFVARRGPRRSQLSSFRDRVSPWLARVERIARPRMPGLLDHPLASAFTGLQLALLGVLLLLPIPLTNYVFAILLLLYAFALIERDGRLMLGAWIAGIVGGGIIAVLSGSAAAAAAQWIEMLA